MVLKNYIYLNILFIFGLILYVFSSSYALEMREIFYLFFSIFGLLVPILFYFNGFKYTSVDEKRAYEVLFFGFFSYGLANLIWYLNDIFTLEIDVSYLNLIFLVQVFSKHYFLKFLSTSGENNRFDLIFQKLFSINILISILALFTSKALSLNGFEYDIYFIIESLVSIIFILYFLNEKMPSHININYFLTGNLVWFIADSLYLFEVLSGFYIIGELSDFVYYVGFYFLLASVVFKNFSFMSNFLQTKNLNFT